MAYGSNILGGYLGTVWTSATYDDNSDATNIGVMTRANPTLNPNNINVRGTGERGLYDILLGTRDPRLTLEFWPTVTSFITSYQDGTSAPAFLHLRYAGSTEGLTLVAPYFNRFTAQCEAGAAVQCTGELWAAGNATYPTGIISWEGSVPSQNWLARVTTPYRWLDSVLSIATVTQTQWWNWRYEVNNNLQRLPNVSTGGTRDVKARTRDVTGLIVLDLEDFQEYNDLADISAEQAKFNVTIEVDSVDLLNCDYTRWGQLEAPNTAADLIAKRFPFTATDLTTLTP